MQQRPSPERLANRTRKGGSADSSSNLPGNGASIFRIGKNERIGRLRGSATSGRISASERSPRPPRRTAGPSFDVIKLTT